MPYVSGRLEHLARSIWGARYLGNWISMLVAYFDESGVQQREIGGLLIVSGWIASVAQWERFEFDWKLFLAKYDVPYLHMKEYAHSVGPFTKWKGKEGTRRNFINDAADIIRNTIQAGFACGVSEQVFDQTDSVYELRSKFSSPYALAGRSCASMAVEWHRKNNRGLSHDIRYVFEDRDQDKGGLFHAMTEVVPAMPSPIFEAGRDQKPSQKWPDGRKGLVQLQAADFLAYEWGKFGSDGRELMRGTRQVRNSMNALPANKVRRIFITSRHLTFFCRGLNIPKRTVVDSSRANAKGQTA